VQDARDHLHVRARTWSGFGPGNRARIIASARTKIPGAISVDVQVVDRLEVMSRGKVPSRAALVRPALALRRRSWLASEF
jgi:hypothetical protein